MRLHAAVVSGIRLRPVFKRRHARLAELRHLHRKLCSTLERQRDRNKSVAWIANKLQEIRLRVAVHYIPANAKLCSDDLNHLARQRRLFTARPAVDQGKIHRTPQIAQRLPRIALANLRIVSETSLAEIALRGRDFCRYEFRTDYATAAVVTHRCSEIQGRHPARGRTLAHTRSAHFTAQKIDEVALLGT